MFRKRYAVCLHLKFSVESENILSDHLNQSRKVFFLYQFYLPKKGEPDEAVVNKAFLYSSEGSQYSVQFSSVQFSRSVVSDSLQPHELQHARSPCASPTPRVHSDSRPSSQ